jgi:hypothetical protein
MTTRADLERIAAAWTRLGVLFNVPPAEHEPDLELLLLETVRAMPANSRLFSAAVTWLDAFGECVDERPTCPIGP